MDKLKKIFDETVEWVRPALKMCIVVLLVATFIVKPAWVSGASMNPTLWDHDFLALWALGYVPEQGDIIACNCPGLDEIIVKRIVACPGQSVTVDFSAGKVYVDGEEFLVNGIENVTTYYEGNYIEDLVVPEGKYFVMGDNRQHSTDSRDSRVGFVDRDDILGKAVLRLYPFKSFGGLYK